MVDVIRVRRTGALSVLEYVHVYQRYWNSPRAARVLVSPRTKFSGAVLPTQLQPLRSLLSSCKSSSPAPRCEAPAAVVSCACCLQAPKGNRQSWRRTSRIPSTRSSGP
jgi:hypothetical protein